MKTNGLKSSRLSHVTILAAANKRSFDDSRKNYFSYIQCI